MTATVQNKATGVSYHGPCLAGQEREAIEVLDRWTLETNQQVRKVLVKGLILLIIFGIVGLIFALA